MWTNPPDLEKEKEKERKKQRRGGRKKDKIEKDWFFF